MSHHAHPCNNPPRVSPRLRPEIVAVLIVVCGFAAPQVRGDEPRVVREAFASDPTWDGFRNRLAPETARIVQQDFGYRATNRAGGARAGEIGGFVQRSSTAAWYAMPIEPRSLDDRLTASGTLSVPSAGGDSGVMIGWFKATPPSWRTPNSLAFRVDGNSDKFWLFYEYGTGQWRTGGGGAYDGPRYQTTSTPPFPADGKPHDWSLDYDPQGANGRGLLTFRIDDRRYELPLHEGHRQDATVFDHFGIWNVQAPGDRLELYLDDLVVDGAKASFDEDPHWESAGNTAKFAERLIRPYHDLGYSRTRHAGGAPGEIGGIIFRDERPAYYAAKLIQLSLDDELQASGQLALLKAASDSGVYLGWFDSTTKRHNETPEHKQRQRNYLGILIEGPSRAGHYVRPGYSCGNLRGRNSGETADSGRRWPIVFPDAKVHTWTIHYRPGAAGGAGRIEITFDDRSEWMNLTPGDRDSAARFDRFGIFNMQSGGHGVEIYLDDVTYTREGAAGAPE